MCVVKTTMLLILPRVLPFEPMELLLNWMRHRYPRTWKFTDNTVSVLVMNYCWGGDVCTLTGISPNHLNLTQLRGYNASH